MDPSTFDYGPPPQLGRYQIQQPLGSGSFGIVYRGYDTLLQIPVAIKVPRRNQLASSEVVAMYLAEARALASLDHPGILRGYDFGETADGSCYLVSRFINGDTLRKRMQAGPLTLGHTLTLIAQAADALDHAHRHGFIHRDIKPSNIMLEGDDRVYLMDFGLALRNEISPSGLTWGGTPAYMSPEQARGEGHRIDGRSDIYSLGIVFFELLCGRRPQTSRRGQGLWDQLEAQEIVSPRRYRPDLSTELERICLKCVARLARDRYATAAELSEDLRLELKRLATGPESSTISVPPRAGEPSTPSSLSIPEGIVPKGLRAFDAEDAPFFLTLLPGPRGRDGLPESLSFWKRRLEARETPLAFSVGVLYGPSGSGKSSLVKAALLPHLAESVKTVYVEASAQQTENALLRGLRRRFPTLMANDLPEALAVLRQGYGLAPDEKVVIVLDQFEQWLQSHRDQAAPSLIRALRQCDGEHVQALVLVRDDFWLATTGFFRELEVPLVEGENCQAVDLFDSQHARKILAAFGRAFGAIPEAGPGPEQQQFLEQAVRELAEDGRIVPVRLSLSAQLLKDRPWIPATLKAVGGLRGLGITFLEETFHGVSAPPHHRTHAPAARRVLQALLPTEGSPIRGTIRTCDELYAVSGYRNSKTDFDQLMRILDGELRLVTPTEIVSRVPPEEASTLQQGEPDSSPSSSEMSGIPGYQLTHDYLVPVLQEWLSRKQRETMRGRAELLLDERTEAWKHRKESRQLPSLLEYVRMKLLVPRWQRKHDQREMMQAAGRFHAIRSMAVVVLLAFFVLSVQLYAKYAREQDLIGKEVELQVASFRGSKDQELPNILSALQAQPKLAERRLRKAIQSLDENDLRRRLPLEVALACVATTDGRYILDHLEDIPSALVGPLAQRWTRSPGAAVDRLRLMPVAEVNPIRKASAAILLLHMREGFRSREMLALVQNPTLRTTWIHRFAAWHGDLADILDLLKINADTALVHGLCEALALVPRNSVSQDTRKRMAERLKDLYCHDRSSGVHAASWLTLRRWQEELPPEQLTAEPIDHRDWWQTLEGYTLARLQDKPTNSIWISMFETTRAQYARFLEDSRADKDTFPQGSDTTAYAPSPDCPALRVSLFNAVRYCNWLSRQAALEPCYVRNINAMGEITWSCSSNAPGYRLPARDEWLLACASGSSSSFFFGTRADLLDKYALLLVVQSDAVRVVSKPVGSYLPNLWGLFDTFGNAAEWTVESSPLSIHAGLLRGGHFYLPPLQFKGIQDSSAGDLTTPTITSGFRVVRWHGGQTR